MKKIDDYGSPGPVSMPIEQRFKRWAYQLFMKDGVAIASDKTQYRIDSPSGSLIRITKKPVSQRVRRRLMGESRRLSGYARSQYDKINEDHRHV